MTTEDEQVLQMLSKIYKVMFKFNGHRKTGNVCQYCDVCKSRDALLEALACLDDLVLLTLLERCNLLSPDFMN